MKCGVYAIRNLVNGKVYIGSTKNFKVRLNAHKFELNRNKHHSSKLQRAWNKYGEVSFVFEKILICSIENLMMYEQLILDLYKSVKKGYNILTKAYSREGKSHSKKVINKMKNFQRSYRKKYEWKGKMLCLSEIAELNGMERDLLIRRIDDGWSMSRAVTEKYHARDRVFTAFGKSRTLKEWADVLEHPVSNFYKWLQIHDNFEDVITAAKRWTIHEVGRSLNANPNRFCRRIDSGWDIANALCLPNFYRYNKG